MTANPAATSLAPWSGGSSFAGVCAPRARLGGTLTIQGPVDEDDPFIALLDAWLDPAMPAARWSVVVGVDDDAEAALEAATARP